MSKRARAAAGSTLTNPDQRPPRIGTDPIVALWVPAVGVDVLLPYELRFALGRAEGSGALVQHPGVSRHHADVERDGNDLRIVNRSKNGIEFRGAMREELTLTAGEMIKLDKVEAFALTRSMMEARQRLSFFLGFGPESTAIHVVRAAARGSSFVVEGASGSCPADVAAEVIRASPRAMRRLDVSRTWVPSGADAARDLCARASGGLLFVDGAALPAMAAPDRARLAGELRQSKWNLIQIWMSEQIADVRSFLGADTIAGWEHVTIPTVAVRIARRELPAMIDHLFASMSVGHRSRDLDASDLRGLLSYAWPGELVELRQCAQYMTARLSNASQERAAG